MNGIDAPWKIVVDVVVDVVVVVLIVVVSQSLDTIIRLLMKGMIAMDMEDSPQRLVVDVDAVAVGICD